MSVPAGISALDVAFVSACAAILAPFVGWLIARSGHDHEERLARTRNEHERRLAHDQRLFDARRDAYKSAVIYCHRTVVAGRIFLEKNRARAKGETWHGMEPPASGSTDDAVSELGGFMAFVSEELDKAIVEVEGAFVELMEELTALGERWETETPPSSAVDRLDGERVAVLLEYTEPLLRGGCDLGAGPPDGDGEFGFRRVGRFAVGEAELEGRALAASVVGSGPAS